MTTRATTLTAADVSVGDSLDELVIPISRTLIVSGALASRDYQDVHHDHELSHERGSPDIFMNILTTNGLVGRYVTDWTGPGGFLKKVDIRLGAPNYPHDIMTLTGKVVEIDDDPADPSRVELVVSVRGANNIGDHVTGTVTLTLPKETS